MNTNGQSAFRDRLDPHLAEVFALWFEAQQAIPIPRDIAEVAEELIRVAYCHGYLDYRDGRYVTTAEPQNA